MCFFFPKKEFHQSPTNVWRAQWMATVPECCRDVTLHSYGRSATADILMGHYAVILQDGLLMEKDFFARCHHFLHANYHVVWLVRCTQDIEDGYLRLIKKEDRGYTCIWDWNKPTTNVGRWTARQTSCSILLQYRELPDGPIDHCRDKVLQKVRWADSDGDSQKIPDRTRLITSARPATPEGAIQWLNGTNLSNLSQLE